MNIVSLKFSPIFCPKLSEDQTKKEKGLYSNLVNFLAAGQKQRSSSIICVLKASARLTKGGHSAILHTNLC